LNIPTPDRKTQLSPFGKKKGQKSSKKDWGEGRTIRESPMRTMGGGGGDGKGRKRRRIERKRGRGWAKTAGGVSHGRTRAEYEKPNESGHGQQSYGKGEKKRKKAIQGINPGG